MKISEIEVKKLMYMYMYMNVLLYDIINNDYSCLIFFDSRSAPRFRFSDPSLLG